MAMTLTQFVKVTFLVVVIGLVAVLWVSSAATHAQRAEPKPQSAETASLKLFIVEPRQIKWTDPPAEVARGTPSIQPGSPLRYTAIQGDPLKPGVPFAIRLSCSDGYIAAPHWHPGDENIVVLKGTFSVGIGDQFDARRAQDIPTGGYGLVPGRMHHFAVCKGETDIFVYGIGPRLNNWVGAPIAK